MTLVESIKQICKKILAYSFPRILSSIDGSTTLPILCYHSINSKKNSECDPLTPQAFEAHLRYIKDNYKVIALSETLKYLSNPSAFKEPALVITFDDGYEDNFENAFQLLKKYELKATIFVVTGFINREVELIKRSGWGPMSWEQIKTMDKSSYIEIGAHSNTHHILSSLDDRDAINEIKTSKQILEEKLGRKVDLFAYPNGQGSDISLCALETVKQIGFKLACSTFWRTTHKENQRFLMNRVMVKGDDTVDLLILKLSGKYDYLYFIHKLRSLLYKVFFGHGIWK